MTDLPEIEPQEEHRPRTVETPRPRAVGSPLAAGNSARPSAISAENEGRRFGAPSAAHQEHALQNTSDPDDSGDHPSSLQRAVQGLRVAWPFVQKILPLLDGQVVTAVSNLLTPHRPAPPQPSVNLVPIKQDLAELQNRHTELRDQIAEQNTSLRRVEDRLDAVREATDRNTLEQQELLEDLKAVGRKANLVAILALCLLAASVAINVVLYLHIQRVLP